MIVSMPRAWVAFGARSALVLTAALLSLVPSPVRAQKAAVDPELARGKAEVASGAYAAAVATLTAAVRRLSAMPGLEVEVADAYLHLGIAYAGLGQISPAKAQFVRALIIDPSLELDPKTAPKAAIDAFEEARREGESEGVVSPDRHAKKKGGKGKLLLALGAVGAGVAVAAVGPGGGHTEGPATFVPIEASPYIQLLSANPGPSTASARSLTVALTVKAVGAGDASFIFVAEALTADGRACLSGQTQPFSTGQGGSVTDTFSIETQCPAPFTTESLQISLQDPLTGSRPYHASYRGEYRVTQ
jgi:tetratricopeptide (TPR) repeat protein